MHKLRHHCRAPSRMPIRMNLIDLILSRPPGPRMSGLKWIKLAPGEPCRYEVRAQPLLPGDLKGGA